MGKTYIIMCHEADHVDDVKKYAEAQNGTIKHEYKLIKGFSVEFPDDHVHTMGQNDKVKSVEEDGEMKTQ